MQGFVSLYLVPHLVNSARVSGTANVAARIPAFLKEFGRLWPGILTTDYEALVHACMAGPEAEKAKAKLARAFLTGAVDVAQGCDYRVFECLYGIAAGFMEMAAVVPEVLSFVKRFYVRMTRQCQIRFSKEILGGWVKLIGGSFSEFDDDGEYRAIRFFAFLMKRQLMRGYEMSTVLVLVNRLFNSRDMTVRVAVGKLLKLMPERCGIMPAASWVVSVIERPPPLSAEVPEVASPVAKAYEKGSGVVRIDLLLCERVFDDCVENIFANVDGKRVVQRGGSAVSLVAMDWERTPRMTLVRTTDVGKRISLVSRTQRNDLLVTTRKSVSVMTAALETRAVFSLVRPFEIIETFCGNQLVTVSNGDPRLELRDLARFSVVSAFDLIGNYPTCVATWCDRPITLVGTDDDSMCMVDMRTNCIVSRSSRGRL